jgi:amidase
VTESTRPDPFGSATELASRIRNGDVRPTEVVEVFLDRIAERDDEINAFTTVIEERARQAAKDAEAELQAKDGAALGPLHGVPVALKDLGFRKEGVPLTSGLQLLAETGFIASDTAAAVERLEDAGAIVIGMTNTPELGHKLTTDNEYIGATVTPFDSAYNAGGSSGGSAAAVAAGMAPVATGSDMGGSVRVPAAACGVFALKPSYGLIPRDGRPNAFGGESHHVTYGPITRTVEDSAVMMDVLSGQHLRDPTSVPVEIDYTGAVEEPVESLRVGYTADMGVFDVDDEVADMTEEAAYALEDAGATVEKIDPDLDLSLDELVSAMLTSGAKAFADGQEVMKKVQGIDLREHPNSVSDTLLTAFELGSEKDASDEVEVDLVRTQFFDAVQDLFEEYDLLATPVMARKGLPLDAEELGIEFEHFLTFPFNLTGHPASSVPTGLTEDEALPVGMQIVGKRYGDDTVLAASAAVERERPWNSLYTR